MSFVFPKIFSYFPTFACDKEKRNSKILFVTENIFLFSSLKSRLVHANVLN